MKKNVLALSLGLMLCSQAFAQQVGIGTNTPDASAKLDIASGGTMGILFPRVALTATNVAGPVTSPANWLTVFNTATAGSGSTAVVPGLYYWSGTAWVKLDTGAWLTDGNTNGTFRTLGTNDAFDLGLETNGSEKVRITTAGNVGIGTTTPHTNAKLHIDLGTSTTDGIIINGTYTSGSTVPNLGAGSRMTYFPGKVAFRVGRVSGPEWDNANVGEGSFVLGINSMASGVFSFATGVSSSASGGYSIAMGLGANASGQNAVAIGSSPTATGVASVALGLGTTAMGENSTAMGNSGIAMGNGSTVMGRDNLAYSYGETVVGIGSTGYTPSTNGATQFRAANVNDRLFVIGNAIDANNNDFIEIAERSNALTMLKNGNMSIGNVTPTQRLHVSGGSVLTDRAYAASTLSITASTAAFNSGTMAATQIRIADNASGTANGNFTYGATAIEGQYLWLTNNDAQSVTFASSSPSTVVLAGKTVGFVYVNGAWNTVSDANIASNNAYIQNQYAAAQTTANYWVSGNGRMDGGLTVGAGATIDNNNTNTGTVSAGAIAFGNGSGEGIGSKRNAGGNQFGLDFYTASANRMAITQAGNVGIGTTSPSNRLHVAAAEGQGIDIGMPNDAMGLNGGSTSIRFYGYRDVTNNAFSAKISAERTNVCCGYLSQGTDLALYTNNGLTAANADNSVERMRVKGNGTVNMSRSVFFDCNDCGSTTAYDLADGAGSSWGDLAIQGRVLSTNANLHLSPPGGSRVIINSAYRSAGGGTGTTGLDIEDGGIRMRKNYAYIQRYAYTGSASGVDNGFTYTLGNWDFCSLAHVGFKNNASGTDEDDDVQCAVYPSGAGAGEQTNYDFYFTEQFNTKRTWFMYMEAFEDTNGITCAASCVNFE